MGILSRENVWCLSTNSHVWRNTIKNIRNKLHQKVSNSSLKMIFELMNIIIHQNYAQYSFYIISDVHKIILRQPEISYDPLDIRLDYYYCESGCFYFSYAIFLEWYFIYHYYERDAIKSLYTLFYGANFHINEDRTESSN